MHLIAYITANQDPHEARSALRERFPSAARIAMRAGWMWSAASNVESGFSHIYAPGFPGIVAAFAAAGVAICDGSALPRIAPPDEVTELPAVDTVSILCAGEHLRREVAAVPPSGLRIAVNRGHVVGCDWHLANDGFSFPGFVSTGDPVRACRLMHAATLPTGSWFDLARIGIHEGTLSPVCAIRLAIAMGAKHIWVYGHDLIAGRGVDGSGVHESETALRDIGTTVATAVAAAERAGVTVHRVTYDGITVLIDDRPIAKPRRGRKGQA